MLRPIVTAVAVVLVSSTALLAGTTAITAPTSQSAEGIMPIGAQIWHEHQFGPTHPLPSPDLVTDPLMQAQLALTERDENGRSVVDWVDLASGARWLALDAPATREADLVEEVVRISHMVGVTPDVVAIRASADAMPADLRAPFTALVAEVADAYAAQIPITKAANAALTVDVTRDTRFLTIEQRDIMVANAERVVGAFNAFRAQVPDNVAQTATPVFSDPEGLVVLGGTGMDTWTRSGTIKDPVLLVDLGGNDVYYNTAGGAAPTNTVHDDSNLLSVSMVFDLAGDDRYLWDGVTAAVQGAGSIGGLGVLIDVEGNDYYSSTMNRLNRGPFTQYIDGGSQGFGEGGVGIQIDGAGDDTYYAAVKSSQGRTIWLFSQGWGGYGGLGISADVQGEDQWLGYGLGITGGSGGFQGVYNNGAGFFGGVGIMTDTGFGNDIYRAYDNSTTTDYYAQGFGAFGGTGIMFEDGGDDDYTAVEISQNPFIVPLLNCAFGTGSLGGAGYFLELSGNDRYYGASGSPRKGYVMNEGFGGIGAGYGLFVDVSGDDNHFMENLDRFGNPKIVNALGVASDGSDTFGRGVLIEHASPLSGINTSGDGGPNRAGHYLDLGGLDTYVGARPSRDASGELGGAAAVWSGGMDANLPSELILGLFR